ncbi:hypothetical protein RTG_02309 [Rhodotorula toruloides ATCC 204091]|uniref:DNA mismatch repair proteins mutS family domain-containing protein n=1 Tax=Rhodotorula toruloides TaxID=5286 RepID=A0A0K3CJD6_RHOTO|nr:hypothetical protein RTG_02309 [Rhodotorula toruloides ATCC 204091]
MLHRARSFSSPLVRLASPRTTSLGRLASVRHASTAGKEDDEGAGRPRGKVLLDEHGIERRALPPLGFDGKPIKLSLSSNWTEPEEAAKLKAKKPRKATTPLKKEAKKADEGQEGIEAEIGAEDAPAKKGRKKQSAQEDAEEGVEEMSYRQRRLTDLEKQIKGFTEQYPDALVLTQVGSFYEAYWEQAKLVTKLLGMRLTSKSFGNAKAPMAGFPLTQMTKHASTLVQQGHKVVIVDEYQDLLRQKKGLIERRVSRVITPGTGVDEAFVKIESPNFVLALGVVDGSSEGETIGMAYRDVSTGASFTRTSTLATLRDNILLVQPKEIVVDEQLGGTVLGKQISELLEGERMREGTMISTTSTDAIPSSSRKAPSVTQTAESVLLAYLARTLVSNPPPRTKSTYVDPASVMQMDAVTLQSLEIRESLRGGLRGSLFGTVKRTVTPGGTRLLADRLCNPSTDLPTIYQRQALAQAGLGGLSVARPYIRGVLRSLDDTPRLLQRLAMNRASAANDLCGLKRTMRALDTIKLEISRALPKSAADAEANGWTVAQIRAIRELVEKLGQYPVLAGEIEAAIDEEALTKLEDAQELKAAELAELGETLVAKAEEKRKKALKRGQLWGNEEAWYSAKLQDLHDKLQRLRLAATDLQCDLQERYHAPQLFLRDYKNTPTVRADMKDGWTKLDEDKRLAIFSRTGKTRDYIVSDWSTLYKEIESTQSKIRRLETDATQVLIARVLEHFDDLTATGDALAELDVALGFAEVAEELDWVKPEVDDSRTLEIVNGRHPTVEAALAAQNRAFHANSLTMRHPDDAAEQPSFIHVLTGPNMAGKSTFLRQTALIAILAQSGSYVPAESARIGVFDRIFSRVGARDELDRDRSTFMIEMDEATSILEMATARSLVLLDELGRGTSPIDGLAIAYAALEHLTHVNRSRTLFATHYHRLGQLLGYEEENPRGKGPWEGVEFWCTDLEESEESVRYLHAIRRGLNSDSAGLVVARLAGMPARAILEARRIRDMLLVDGQVY